jgi:hypothetical protein
MIDDPPLPPSASAWLPANLAFGWLAFDDPSATGNILEEFKHVSPEIDRLRAIADPTMSLEAFIDQYQAPTNVGAFCDRWRILKGIVDRTEAQVRTGQVPAYLESDHRVEKTRVPTSYFDEGLTIHMWSGRLEPSSSEFEAGYRAAKKLKASGSDGLIWFRREDLTSFRKVLETRAVIQTVQSKAVPRQLPLWLTPMQAVAWVCTRHPGAVWRADLETEYSPDLGLDEATIEEYFPPGTGITILTLAAWHGIHGDVDDWTVPPDDALAALVDRLRSGELQSNAVDFDERRVAIDASDWRMMTLSEGNDPRLLVPSRSSPQFGEIKRWRDILVSRVDLFGQWPPLESDSVPSDMQPCPGESRVSRADNEGRYEPLHRVTACKPITIASRDPILADLPAAKRGPKGGLTDAAAQKMAMDIREGKQTVAGLRAMKQDSLAALYGVGSRDTAIRALQRATAIVDAPTPDK